MGKVLSASTNVASLRKTVRVEFPEIECTIILREMSYGRLMSFDNEEDRRDVIKQLSYMIVDEDGNLVFTTPEDLKKLAEMGMTVINRLAEAAGELNGSSAKAVEDVAKNLQPSPSADSASA